MRKTFQTKGVCARAIEYEVEDGTVKDVKFVGGCSGNTQGVARLVVGMPVEKVVGLLDGIKCGMKSTSCPAQLAQALKSEM